MAALSYVGFRRDGSLPVVPSRGVPVTLNPAFKFTNTQVEFPSGEVICRGWFYRPEDAPSRGCVVMAHGFGASPDGPLGQVASRFASAGVGAFAFDYRNFGSSDGHPRQLFSVRRQLEDWAAAIAYVRGRPDVDPSGIGLWGSSASGGQVLAVAAGDSHLAGVVAQVPYADGLSLARSAGVGQLLRLAPAIGRDLLCRASGRPLHLIDGITPAGAPSGVTTRFPDVYPSLVAQAPGWVNKINASGLLDLWRFRPFKAAGQIRCPLLVVLVYDDLIAPAQVAMRAARGLPYVELALFQGRHFDLYIGETNERATQTELHFFEHHLGRGDSNRPAKRETPPGPHSV